MGGSEKWELKNKGTERTGRNFEMMPTKKLCVGMCMHVCERKRESMGGGAERDKYIDIFTHIHTHTQMCEREKRERKIDIYTHIEEAEERYLLTKIKGTPPTVVSIKLS